jgi:hypothetical protein
MSGGFNRRPYQVLPQSAAKVTCVEINDSGQREEEWFVRSFQTWFRGSNPVVTEFDQWDFVLVVPLSTVKQCWCANDGMQAWRHRKTGMVIPDHCRQTGGGPEVWDASDVKGKRELQIANLAEIEPFVVLEHTMDSRRGYQALFARELKETF